MRVSVVVPTYRRPDLLARCLAALAAQDLDPADYEIIVADDAASDATRRQVEDWAGRGRRRRSATSPVTAPTARPRRGTPAGGRPAARSSPSPTTIASPIPAG